MNKDKVTIIGAVNHNYDLYRMLLVREASLSALVVERQTEPDALGQVGWWRMELQSAMSVPGIRDRLLTLLRVDKEAPPSVLCVSDGHGTSGDHRLVRVPGGDLIHEFQLAADACGARAWMDGKSACGGYPADMAWKLGSMLAKAMATL